MDLKDLQCFVVTAERLNFTQAARQMGMSQPALSRRISALEEELATELFLRGPRSVTLSSAGQLLLPEAKELLLRFDGLRAFLRQGADQLVQKGHLSIGVNPGEHQLGNLNVHEVIGSFMEENPGIQVELLASNSLGMMDVEAEGYDLLFLRWMEWEPVPPELEYLSLANEEHLLVVSAKLRDMTAEEILATKTICLLRSNVAFDGWNSAFLRRYCPAGHLPQVRYLDSVAAQQLAVLSPDNCSLLPESAYRQFASGLTAAHSLPKGPMNSGLYLVWRRDNTNQALPLLVERFRRWLAAREGK